MTWARLDDKFHGNRKIKRAWKASRAAVGLHVMAIAYSADYLTDGFVDEEFVEEKLAKSTERRAALDALTTSGLWLAVDGGWEINDFLDFNPSREDVENARAAKSDAGKKGAAARWSHRQPHGTSHGEGVAGANGTAYGKAMADDAPVPEPVPIEKESEEEGEDILDPDWLPPYLHLFRDQGPKAPAHQAIFCFWRDLYEHHEAALDKGKREAISEALKLYPPERVARAVAGGKLDPFLRGENEGHKVHDRLSTLLKLGKRRGERNNVEHLSELYDEKEPRFKDEPWEVAMQNAVGHRAWQREAWGVLEEQELWLARHGRRLRVDASAKWQRFVDETGYDATQLRVAV